MKNLLCMLSLCMFFACTSQTGNLISNLKKLREHEGTFVLVSGKLLPADVMKRTPVRLQLQDSSVVYIGTFDFYSGLDIDHLEKLQAKNVIVNGRFFFDEIPDQYKIISRLNGPYLVGIKEVKLKE